MYKGSEASLSSSCGDSQGKWVKVRVRSNLRNPGQPGSLVKETALHTAPDEGSALCR